MYDRGTIALADCRSWCWNGTVCVRSLPKASSKGMFVVKDLFRRSFHLFFAQQEAPFSCCLTPTIPQVIVGFRKEQVNASFLNGKGEIQHIELNCSFLNQELAKTTPYIQAERVSVSKLSIKVELASWRSTTQRTPQIFIFLDHVEAVLSEPLHYVGDDKQQREKIYQLLGTCTSGQWAQAIAEGLVPSPRTNAYSVIDRILANMTVEIRSVRVTLQCRGKFKTEVPGPWTPPAWRLDLFGVRWVTVDEMYQEQQQAQTVGGGESSGGRRGRRQRMKKTSVSVFKRLETEYRISLVVPDNPTDSNHTGESLPRVVPIVSSIEGSNHTKVAVNVAMEQRLRDGALLTVQADVTIPRVEMEISSEASSLPHLVHGLKGLVYCMAKDRAFVDPLKRPNTKGTTSIGSSNFQEEPQPILKSSSQDSGETTSTAFLDETIEFCDPIEEGNEMEGKHDDGDDDDKTNQTQLPEHRQEPSSSTTVEAKPSTHSPVSSNNIAKHVASDEELLHPVFATTSGIVIYEKLSLSLTIHHASMRGVYSDDSGRLDLESRGIVLEAIWPQVNKVRVQTEYMACCARLDMFWAACFRI